jgi:hypothetical protein
LVIDPACGDRDALPMTASHTSPPARGPRLAALAAVGLLVVLGAGSRCAGVTTGPAARSARPSPEGFVTYRLANGHVYELPASTGASAVDVSAALNRLPPGARDEWLNTSPNGQWLLMSTERFGCGGWACLARLGASLRTGAVIRASGSALHADAFGAVSSDGRTVVYPQGGGPHVRDLWVTRLIAGRWTAPALLTGASPQRYNMQPAISGDGRRVLFDCGPGVPEIAGTAICSVSTSGGPVTQVIGPTDGPGGTAHNLVHHAAFGSDGAVVFEADWRGEQIWRLAPGSRRPLLVSRVHDDNSPCVLPDGRIASIYFDRPGNRSGIGELRIADPYGGHGTEVLSGRDVADIGIGCGGDRPPLAPRATPAGRTRPMSTASIAAPRGLSGHPRIFLDTPTLERLRARARAGDPAWLAVRTRCDAYRASAVQWPDGDQYPPSGGIGSGYQGDGYLPALLDVALCYEVALGLDSAAAAGYARVGAAVLEHMSAPDGPHAPATLRDSGYGVRYYAPSMSIGYDWLYPALSTSLRERVATAIERWVGDFERAGFERKFPQGNYFAGYYAAKAYAGIALSGDMASGATLLTDWRVRIQGGLVQPYYAANLAGGGWPEGWNYGPIAGLNMSLPTLAARTALCLDLIHAPGRPYLYPLTNPRFILYFTWPSMTTLEDSSALYSSANPSVAAPWLFTTEAGLLTALHDPFAPFFHSYAQAARRAQPGGQLGGDWDLWENLLFWDKSAPERQYTTLPLSYYARGIEMAAVRSDWSRRAVWAAFKAGPYINFADNGEEYFDKGSLAIVNGSHPLLVNANGALLRDTPGTSDGDRYYQPIYDDLFSDTGRRDIFNIFYTDRPVPLGQSDRSRSAGARTHIGQFEDRGTYTLMQGVHLEDMYPRSGARTIEAWTRTIVYLRPGTFIVYDRTSVTSAGVGQWLAFHLGGRVAPVPGAAGGVRRYDVTGRGGYAGSVYTVLPGGHRDAVSGLLGGEKVSSLEVRPGQPAREQQWLTIFDAAPGSSRAGAVSVLAAIGEPAAILVRQSDGDTAVLFGGNEPADVRYRLPDGRVRSLVTGLRPRGSYTVDVERGIVDVRPGPGERASNSGVLSFSSG